MGEMENEWETKDFSDRPDKEPDLRWNWLLSEQLLPNKSSRIIIPRPLIPINESGCSSFSSDQWPNATANNVAINKRSHCALQSNWTVVRPQIKSSITISLLDPRWLIFVLNSHRSYSDDKSKTNFLSVFTSHHHRQLARPHSRRCDQVGHEKVFSDRSIDNKHNLANFGHDLRNSSNDTRSISNNSDQDTTANAVVNDSPLWLLPI